MAEGTGMVAVILTLIIAAVGLVIGMYVYTIALETLDNDVFTNESIGYFNLTGSGPNTLCLDHAPVLSGSYTIYNSTLPFTVQNTLTEATDYTINMRTGCITNVTECWYLRATYTQGRMSSTGSNTLSSLESSTYSAYELAVVGLIVLAAVAVLGYVFILGGRRG